MNVLRRPARSLVIFAAVLSLAAVACIPDAGPAPALDAADANPAQPYGWMQAGLAWHGDFPDPDIIQVGSMYYAYATNSSGRYMPVLESRDLVNWVSPPRYTTAAAPWAGGGDPHADPAIPIEIRDAGLDDGDTWNLNDALVKPPSWGKFPTARSARRAGCGGQPDAGAAPGDVTRTPCAMVDGLDLLSGGIGPAAAPRADPTSLVGSTTLVPPVPSTTSTTTPSTTTTAPVAPAAPLWPKVEMWAPGVIQIGSRFYAYSAVLVEQPAGVEYGRFCLTVARSDRPTGPFRDISGSQPILCDVDPGGSIDPSPFRDPKTGDYWLLWKATGNGGSPGHPTYPAALKSIRIASSGAATGMPFGGITSLLKTQPHSWEGFTIEDPSMVYWQKKYWLFYSANKFLLYGDDTSPYATGYAVCAGPTGPCTRTSGLPLVASNPSEIGPGGGSPIVDRQGHLRLAIAYYWPGDQRPGGTPRRMKVLTLSRRNPITLTVVR